MSESSLDRLRVVLVNPYLPPPMGGIEVELLALAEEWSRSGHQVHLVTTDCRFPRGSNRSVPPRLPEGVGLTRLRGRGRAVLRGFQPSRAPLLVPGLVDAIRRPEPQLVVVFNVGWPLTLWRALGTLRDTPVLYRTYYHPPGGRLRRVKERLLLGAVARANLAVAASRAEREQLLATGLLLPERVRVVSPGVAVQPPDPEGLERFRSEHGLTGRRVILHVARLSHFKGTAHLIEVLTRVRARAGDDVVLVLVGRSDERSALEASIARLDLAEHVRWVGEIPDQATLGLAYRAAHVFALPSAYESFGFVYLEALSEGVPVVACAGGGVAEAVGEDGIILPAYGRLDALEEALVELLTDEERRRSLGERGRRRVRERHQWRHAARDLLALHEELRS